MRAEYYGDPEPGQLRRDIRAEYCFRVTSQVPWGSQGWPLASWVSAARVSMPCFPVVAM